MQRRKITRSVFHRSRYVCDYVSGRKSEKVKKGGRRETHLYKLGQVHQFGSWGLSPQPPWEQRPVCMTYEASINGLLLHLAIKVCQEQPGYKWELFFTHANGNFMSFKIYCANYLEGRKPEWSVIAQSSPFLFCSI